jgi:membrane protein
MRMKKFLVQLRKIIEQALHHNVINTAKAVAYSGMLMLFPALLVITTLVAQVPEGSSFVGEIRVALEQILPADSMDLLQFYVLNQRIHSGQVILSATSLSLFASMGMMLSFMEGFRRAYRLPMRDWSFWGRRLRALLLIPIVLLPLTLATLVVVFGHQIEIKMFQNTGHELRFVVVIFWRMVRWMVATTTSIAVLTALYHFGTRRMEKWFWVIPGAAASTLIWFPATLAFGWYVTRIADYSMFYGSFGAGIATLVWLYISAFSVLIGAELNGAVYRERRANIAARARFEDEGSGL